MNKDQIIKIQGDQSGWYKQAVFVIKDDMVSVPTYKDLKMEAERIIGNYAKHNGLYGQRPYEPKPLSNLDTTLNLILWGSICVLTICLCIL